MIRLRIPTEGSVRFDGQDLALLSTKELRRMRRRMQIIFQDPYGSLDPRMTVSSIIAEPISEIEDRSDLDAVESVTDHAKRDAESMVGDELPGGTVAVPDNDRVDDWAGALGVERSPDSPVRTSAEILDSRDRRRPGRHPEPKL